MKKFLFVALLAVVLLSAIGLVGSALAQDEGTTTQDQTSPETGLEAFFNRVAEILGLPADQVKTAITQAWQETGGWRGMMNGYGGMMGNATGEGWEQMHEQCEQMMGTEDEDSSSLNTPEETPSSSPQSPANTPTNSGKNRGMMGGGMMSGGMMSGGMMSGGMMGMGGYNTY